ACRKPVVRRTSQIGDPTLWIRSPHASGFDCHRVCALCRYSVDVLERERLDLPESGRQLLRAGRSGLAGWAESGQCVGLKSGGVRRRVGGYILGYRGKRFSFSRAVNKGAMLHRQKQGGGGGERGAKPHRVGAQCCFWE